MSSFEIPYSLTGKRVWVAGHRGMVGSALVRRLAAENCELLTVTRQQADLRIGYIITIGTGLMPG